MNVFFGPSFPDIQEFYEVTLLDSQRWTESSKGADPVAPVNLWDFSSLPSTTVTSDTLPSLSTSIEVRTDRLGAVALTTGGRAEAERPSSESVYLLLFTPSPRCSWSSRIRLVEDGPDQVVLLIWLLRQNQRKSVGLRLLVPLFSYVFTVEISLELRSSVKVFNSFFFKIKNFAKLQFF